MGSMVSLGIGKLEIDWGKNSFYRNHGCLFQHHDIKDIPYYYADNIVEHKEGISRKLGSMKRRLDLLGYSKNSLRNHYEEHLDTVPDYYSDVPLSYDDFYAVVSNLDVSKITPDDQYGDHDPGEFLSRYLFKHPEFNKVVKVSEMVDKDIGLVFENMDPYITLRILAENPKNLDLEVYWGYFDIVDNGWVEKSEILEGIGKGNEILVVTEGSSDTHILKHALELVCPDISDFFYFVDMEENYPFTGDGNLFNFCKGLASINIKNNVLVIFDNDAAGVKKYKQSISLNVPSSMHITKLPDHDDFSEFSTIGPQGQSVENINGTAVAIECFLDLSYKQKSPPLVRWTSYNRELNAYQGELASKEKYTKAFLKLKSAVSDYNFDKLNYLLEYLIESWIDHQTQSGSI